MAEQTPKISSGFEVMLDWVQEGVRNPHRNPPFVERQWKEILKNNPLLRHSIMQLSREVGGQDPSARGKVARALTGLLYLRDHPDIDTEFEALFARPYSMQDELPFPAHELPAAESEASST